MSEGEGQTMEMKTAVETEGAYTELGRNETGAIIAYLEGDNTVTVTWTREEAARLHSLLGHLLYS